MDANITPAIIIVAFNRPNSLKRLLSSLNRIHPKVINIQLIISIDYSLNNEEVVLIAEEYKWKFGPKKVITHEERLGLRNHIIKCGDLSQDFGSVIILEDDLMVSPYFYNYAVDAIEFYQDDDLIGGISLYSQPYTESVKLPFIPLKEESDVYFMQIASSLGQAWTSKQWRNFREWYDTNPEISTIEGLPIMIKRWPQTSWKKYYCAYLVEYNKYFVFPHLSYTTNFNDPGSNIVMKSYMGQTQISIFNNKLNYKKLEDSLNVYDAYSEIQPDRLKMLAPQLNIYDFEVDIYGKKETYKKEFVLTSRPSKNPIYSFEKSMKPHELNIIYNLSGNDISFVQSRFVMNPLKLREELYYSTDIAGFIKEFTYYYLNIFRISFLFKLLLNRLYNKISRILRW